MEKQEENRLGRNTVEAVLLPSSLVRRDPSLFTLRRLLRGSSSAILLADADTSFHSAKSDIFRFVLL